MRISRDGLVLTFLFVALLVGAYYVAAPRARQPSDVSTTYSADPKGVKAFYTLLSDRLEFRTACLRRPYTQLPSDAAVLVVVQPLPAIPIEPDERAALTQWVRKGGVVVFVSDAPAILPAGFRSQRGLGKGHVYVLQSRKFVTNEGLRSYRNALEPLAIIFRHAAPNRLVLFDEYHHGFVESDSWSMFGRMSRQVKIALAMLLAAGLVLCYSRGRRFGSVRRLPQKERLRPGFEFVESVARLYQRARAPHVAAGILCDSFSQNLCSRLGLPADADLRQVTALLAGDSAAQVDRVLRQCERLKAGYRPTETELVDIAGQIHRLEKELGLVRTGS